MDRGKDRLIYGYGWMKGKLDNDIKIWIQKGNDECGCQIWIDGYIDMDRCREMWIYRFQIEGYKKGLISSLYEGMQL